MKRSLEKLVRSLRRFFDLPSLVVGIRIGSTSNHIYVAHSGKVRYTRGKCGVKLPGRKKSQIHTRIGSITKTFVVTLLLQIVERGLVSLDDPIRKWRVSRGVPNRNATLRQLANMTSGIPDYTTNPLFVQLLVQDPFRVWRPQELLQFVAPEPEFVPGTAWKYSNTNAVLIGLILETVTGQSLERLLTRFIFKPLSLKNTVFPTCSSSLPIPYLEGHTDNDTVVTTCWSPSWAWASGALIASVPDLLQWSKHLATGKKLVGRTMQTERLTSFLYHLPPNGPTRAYGLGLGAILVLGEKWLGHEGEMPGYDTLILYNPAHDTSVVITVGSSKEINLPDMGPVSPAHAVFAVLSVLFAMAWSRPTFFLVPRFEL